MYLFVSNAKFNRLFPGPRISRILGSSNDTLNTLVRLWDPSSLYVFNQIQLLPRLLPRIHVEKLPVILIATAWARRKYYPIIVVLSVDVSWSLPAQ